MSHFEANFEKYQQAGLPQWGTLIFFRLTLCPSLELYLLLKKNLWNPRNSSARMLRVSSKFQIVTNKTKITLTLTALTSLFLLRFFYIYHSFLLFSAWSVNLCFAWTGKQRQLTLSYLQLIKPAAGRPLGFWEILTRPKKNADHTISQKIRIKSSKKYESHPHTK